MSSIETKIQVAKPGLSVAWMLVNDGTDGGTLLACGRVFVSKSSNVWETESMEDAMIQGSFSGVAQG
ncbi:hypothetical protein D0865_11659 [Hortaea werneckii]|uniref:Uncharacterized protein n=1 Tax=Hortaea werneckii TaxID=91943 RepID=A0A3M7BSR0_HORWE|nr:hypothetical protein D0865_11659 [Hortaea werneckii]